MNWILVACLLQAWQPCSSMPTARYGFASAAVGDLVYVAGGASGSMQQPIPEAALEAYDPAGDSWVTGLPPLPLPRFHCAGAALDGKIYVLGGTDGRAEFARVDRYDPVARAWDTVAALPVPTEALAAAVYNNHLYAVGGFSGHEQGQYLRRVLKFVPDGGPGQWQAVDSLEVPRASLGAAAAGGRLYAVGGRYFNSLGTAESYDGTSWSPERATMSQPRSGLACAGWDVFVCAAGGSGQSMPMNSVEVLNTVTGEWASVEPMTSNRMFAGAAVVDERLYVIGGREMHGPNGSVESHELWHPGVAEPPGSLPGAAVGRTSVSRFGLNLGLGEEAEVFDIQGRRVFAGRGPADVRFGPGLYIVHRGHETGRLLVVR